MSIYRSSDSIYERPRPHFEGQSSDSQSHLRWQQQQTGGLVLSTHAFVRPLHQFDDRARVDDGWQHQLDHCTSNTLATTSWRQHQSDQALFRDMHQRPFANLDASSRLTGRSLLRHLENQDSTAQLPSSCPVAENDLTKPNLVRLPPENGFSEPAPVRLPTLIYCEPLPPCVPDESSQVQYYGEVVPPQRLGSYFLQHNGANPMPYFPQQQASQSDLDHTAPIHRQTISNFALRPTPPQPPKNYLAWSIINVLFGCFLLGGAALAYSCVVIIENEAGRYHEAQRKSMLVRVLNVWSTALILLILASIGVSYLILGS